MTTQLRIGAVGLGRAFMLMLPTFAAHPRVRLVAASDPRPEARAQFARDFGGVAHETFEALCADPAVEAIYIASPHQFHAEQVLTAARHGKHLLVEKPMALTIAECMRMNEAAERARIHLLVGHSHSFDAPFLRARAMIASGEVGRVRGVLGQLVGALAISLDERSLAVSRLAHAATRVVATRRAAVVQAAEADRAAASPANYGGTK